MRLLGHRHQAELELGPRLHHPYKNTGFIKGTVRSFKSKEGQSTEPVFLTLSQWPLLCPRSYTLFHFCVWQVEPLPILATIVREGVEPVSTTEKNLFFYYCSVHIDSLRD